MVWIFYRVLVQANFLCFTDFIISCCSSLGLQLKRRQPVYSMYILLRPQHLAGLSPLWKAVCLLYFDRTNYGKSTYTVSKLLNIRNTENTEILNIVVNQITFWFCIFKLKNNYRNSNYFLLLSWIKMKISK